MGIAADSPIAPHEALFWRRAARWGSTRGPEAWLKYAPPMIGWVAAACVPAARHTVRKNLHRLRGPAPFIRDARDVLSTFGTYASCLAEVLAYDSPEGPPRPRAFVRGDHFVTNAIRAGRGVILVTAHTAGWEAVGPLLGKTHDADVMLVTHREPDERAGRLQDEARRRAGVSIVHVGEDPLATLPLLRHLRDGGIVALQLDRVVPGMRTRTVPLLGAEGAIPEGPLRLAQVSGAPIIPTFSARRGHREYLVHAYAPRHLGRRPTEAEIDDAAAYMAECMTRFLRAHPTHWFQFSE